MQLEEIKTLCDEVSSLVDAGLPLETHLAEAGKGHGQRLQSMTELVVERLERGDDLQEIVNAPEFGRTTFVPAAIAAGVQTGRLSDTVEIMGNAATALLNVRRRLIHSITYPFLVMLVACLLFSIFVSRYLAAVSFTLSDLGMEDSVIFKLVQLNRSAPWWPMILPAVGAVLIFVWFVSGRAATLTFQGLERLLLLLPGVSGLMNHLHRMTFGRMLSLMVERSVPLPKALVLAGHCCGDSAIARASELAAQKITSGQSTLSDSPHRLPAMFEACLEADDRSEDRLNIRLPAITTFYERRLQASLAWLSSIVPAGMLIIVGGGAVALYAVSVFWPMTDLFFRLPGV